MSRKQIALLLTITFVAATSVTGCLTQSDSAFDTASIILIQRQAVYINILISALALILVFVTILLVNIIRKRKVIAQQSQNLQESLHESNRSLDIMTSILNKSDVMIYVTDMDTYEILFINDLMKRHFDLDDSTIGKPCYKIFQEGKTGRCDFCPCHQLDREPDKVVVWEDRNSITNRYYRKSDRYTDWPGGKKVHMQHCVDITDVKKVQEELEIQKNTLQTMINSMPDFVFGKNLNFEYTLLNNSAAKYLNVDMNDVIGKNDIDGLKFPPDVAEIMVSQDKTIFKGEEKFIDEHWIPAYDGSLRYFETTKAPVIQNGVVIGLVGTSRDITEKMQMEKDLEAALEQVTKTKDSLEYEMMKYELVGNALDIGRWDVELANEFMGMDENKKNKWRWSQEFRNLLGFTDETDFPDTLEAFESRVHPEDLATAFGAFAAHCNDHTGRTPYNIEYRLRHKNGKYRYFDGFGMALRNKDGVPLRVSGAIRDITEKKQMEAALREATFNARNVRTHEFISKFSVPFTQPYDFNELIDNALFDLRDFTGTDRAIIIELQQDGSLLCTHENVINEKTPSVLGDLMPHEERAPVLREADKTGCFYQKDAETYFAGYSARSLGEKSFCCIPITIGGHKVGYLVFFTMFEQANWAEGEFRLAIMAGSIIAGAYSRKMSEDAMFAAKEAELRTQEFISKFSVPFTQPYDFDVLINNALFELRDFTGTDRAIILELTSDEFMFCTYENLISKETPSVFRTTIPLEKRRMILEEADKTGCFYEKDAQRYCSEHSMKGLGEKSFCVIPLMVEGERTGYLVFFTMFEQANWTEGEFRLATMAGSIIAGAFSIRKNNALKEEIIKVQQANEAKSNFLSVMSHEMRTPLNAIIGMTAIGKDAQDAVRKDYALKKIEDASASLLGIINDVLDMAKIEANKLELSPIEYNIERMLRNVISVVKFRMVEKQQKFNIHFDFKVPYFIVGDDQRLSQILTNLLSNASKFTPENGNIQLNITLDNKEDGGCQLRFEVIDDGIGISHSQQEKLFQAFSQAENGTSRTFGGTGLGLALSKRIVDLMDGSIWVESELGKGAKFIFTVKTACGKQHLSSLLSPGIQYENIKILVVDDDTFMLEYFSTIFNQIGIRCDVVSGSSEALRMIDENGDYDIYFIDWLMIGMEGSELTKRIKERKFENESVVTMLSGDLTLSKGDAFKAGVDKFIMKPLFALTIIERINECLEVKTARQEETLTKVTSGQFCGKKLLLAEDIEINREIIISLLDELGLIIDEAENGQEAFEKVKADPERYDLVFMDLQMPKMDGLDATRQIRSLPDEHIKTLPIIALTANVFKEDVEKCLKAGMNGHIGKPVNMDEILEILKKYLID